MELHPESATECSECGSVDLECLDSGIDGFDSYYAIKCNACDNEWSEEFSLVSSD